MAAGQHFDVMVLGAGIVGISTAIHLQKRGLSTVLIDRRGPGEETSHGNAGIIQREGVHPYLFPRSLQKLLPYAFNLKPEAQYQLGSLARIAPFLLRYLRSSNPASARRTLEANIPLFEQCLTSHEALAAEAGGMELISRGGWLNLLRGSSGVASAEAELKDLAALGIDADFVTSQELAKLEPHLDTTRAEAVIHYRDPWTVRDPGALCKAYARLFETLGGHFVQGDAGNIRRSPGGFSLGETKADQAIIALGPWSKPLLDQLGLKLPMGIKRGYHQHFRPVGNGGLNRPVLDSDNGFVLAPMAAGIRLTTGAEFAVQNAPFNPVQVAMTLPRARELVALGHAVEDRPWMGSRPVFPDMLPVIGAAPGIPGLWLNFGHAHHGLTLGPATGILLAQMITGQTPFCDVAPYSAQRFTGW